MSALDSIRQRAENATPGPWEIIGGGEYITGASILVAPDDGGVTDADAEFIAAARTDIPRLLAALDAVMELRRFSIMKNDPVNEYGHGYNAALIKVRAAITQALGEAS